MRNIAIIPARSGSKGLKDKNIKLLDGKPLLWYTIKVAKESKCFDEIMVSTDSEKYAQIAKECGAAIPFFRSADKSSDTAGSWEVVKEVLANYLKTKNTFDTICLLQPTSPLRSSINIIEAYRVMDEKKASAVTSVCEVDHSPLWDMVLPDDGSLSDFRKNLRDVPRQKLKKYYRLNGAIYIRKIEYKDSKILIEDNKEFAYIMDRRCSIDIDTQEDFELAEFYMSKNK